MGSLSKALRKANGLQPLIKSLKGFIDSRRKRSSQDDFNKLMSDAITNIKKTFSDPSSPEDNISFSENISTKMGEDFLPSTTEKPEVKEQPTDIILGDIEGRKFGTISPDEQRMKIQRQIAETMIKANQLNIDPKKIKKGVGILELIGKSVTPAKKVPVKKTIKSFDPKKDLFEVDDQGNIKKIRTGIKVKKENKTKKIGSYIGKDGFHYIQMYEPATDTVKEIKSKNPVRVPKTTTVKFPKADKWKDFGSVINSIKFKLDAATGDITNRTPIEQKQMREIGKNKAVGLMLPGAIDFWRTRIVNAWGRENISQADFEAEIEEGINDGEIDPEEAQDLLDFNQFRPYLYDALTETKKVKPE